jgi:TetR/AcrR family transcriptional regulator
MAPPDPSRTHTDRSAQTRARILDAALREFSAHGLAGARTEAIAASAGVNKALLYYHFESKENLYIATLEKIGGKVRDSTLAVLQSQASAGERLLRMALNHFDRILTQQDFQRLMQQEMIRIHKGESGALPILVKRVFGPLLGMIQAMVQEGIRSGELIDVDWLQIPLAALGANVFYFLSAPVWQVVLPLEPFAPAVIAARRKGLVEFLGQAVFQDRRRGAELTARVLADSPMPELNKKAALGRNDERAK